MSLIEANKAGCSRESIVLWYLIFNSGVGPYCVADEVAVPCYRSVVIWYSICVIMLICQEVMLRFTSLTCASTSMLDSLSAFQKQTRIYGYLQFCKTKSEKVNFIMCHYASNLQLPLLCIICPFLLFCYREYSRCSILAFNSYSGSLSQSPVP